MTDYKQGDVVLVPYPFGERASKKKRPALVISSTDYNQITGELVIAQVTGRVAANARLGDSHIQGWREANLPRPALVRCRLATVKSSLVLRRLGELSEADFQAVLTSLNASMLG
jgi:mRNA interferase MazF